MSRLIPIYPDPPDPGVAEQLSELLLRRLAEELLRDARADDDEGAGPREEPAAREGARG